MSANTKIVVLKMKNVVITLIFSALILVLAILFVLMFKNTRNTAVSTGAGTYIPGVYTSAITLNNQEIDVSVTVSSDSIDSIYFKNLSETVTTMFPLMESALESVSVQIISNQSTDDLVYADDMKYTSQLLVDAIKKALEYAKSSQDSQVP